MRQFATISLVTHAILAGLLCLPVPAAEAPEADEQVAPSSPWAARRYAVFAGYSGSTVEVDVEREGEDRIGFNGWAVMGRIGLKEVWGVQFGFRGMGDDESYASGEEISLDLVGVDGYLVWLETRRTRWHAKAGLAWMEFESEIPGVGSFSDDGFGPVIGIGFEWGTPKYAFFVDFGLAFANVELIPGEDESLLVGNTITGFIYKF